MISRLEHDERPPDVATIHACLCRRCTWRSSLKLCALIELANTARNGEADDSLHKLALGRRRSYMPQRLPACGWQLRRAQ